MVNLVVAAKKQRHCVELYGLEYGPLIATFDEAALDFLIENGFRQCHKFYIDGEHIGYTEFYAKLTGRLRMVKKNKLVQGIGVNDADYTVNKCKNRKIVWPLPLLPNVEGYVKAGVW